MKATLILMALLVAGVRADDLDDYVATAYGGRGQFVRVGSTYVGNVDIITKAGSAYVSSRGIATRAGSTYISEDNDIVVKAGSAYVSSEDIVVKAGSTYNGKNGTTIGADSYMYKP